MTRVASLYLPQLPIERLRRAERPVTPPEPIRPHGPMPVLPPIDDDPGACSAPRGGGWRPGARWARDGVLSGRQSQAEIDTTTPGPGRLPAMPLVLIERRGQQELIAAACPVALGLGLRPGMPAAQARAQVSDLDLRDADRHQDLAFLDRLALHAVTHWTPTANVSGADGLWLDLTGTTHLFGGEARFCRRLVLFARRLGFTASIAIAGTPGAAHALARYAGNAVTVLPPGAEAQAIADLPLASLRLSSEALMSAARFGLERVGDLYPMPRGPLARRLGMETVRRLDQARGSVAEPIVPVVPFEEPRAERRLLEPIGTPEAIAQVIGDLVDDLVSELRRRGLGLHAAVLTCVRVDAGEQRISLGAARATRDAKHLKRMLAMRIERIEPGLGIEAMTLRAPGVEPLQPHILDVGLAGDGKPPDIARLVDQLAGRVGEAALFRVGSVESDVPERATHIEPPLAKPPGWPSWRRPVRLLRRPEQLSQVVALLPDHPPRRFTWRRQQYRVIAGDGPERIHGEWWRNARELWAVRDYFAVETEGGERFWLFRRGDGVDAPTGDLSWYMHGLFG